jgi:hypothetical protein
MGLDTHTQGRSRQWVPISFLDLSSFVYMQIPPPYYVMKTGESQAPNRKQDSRPIGTIKGGLAISKMEGWLKKLVRNKGKGHVPIMEPTLFSEGTWVLRVDRPQNGMT